MKPVRRRIRKHFGLTAKQVSVRSKRPWYMQWGMTALFVCLGYLAGYWQYADGSQQLKQVVLENQTLNSKIIQVERQLQIQHAAQSTLETELNSMQDENLHMKENLVFYKNMLNGKK